MSAYFDELEFELLALHYINEYFGGTKKIEKTFNDFKLNEVKIYISIFLLMYFLIEKYLRILLL